MKKTKTTRKSNGITLIGLVVTIIVLLILAGISISMLSGENSILTRAGDAKIETRGGVVQEERDLWKLSQETDRYTNDSSTESLSELLTRLVSQGSLTETEKTEIEETGQVTIGKRKIVFSKPTAKSILKVNTLASNEVEKSPYIRYKYKDENGEEQSIMCRVLYNDSIYGLQIIAVDPVTIVGLGTIDEYEIGSGINKAQNSYNNAIKHLNAYAENYLNGNEFAEAARCVGSNPLDKNNPDNLTGNEKIEQMFTAESNYTYMNNYNGMFYKEDINYLTDENRIKELQIRSTSHYWYASRSINSTSNATLFGIRADMQSAHYLWFVDNDGYAKTMAYEAKNGFRPVFTLKSETKIIEGTGTKTNPYLLGW